MDRSLSELKAIVSVLGIEDRVERLYTKKQTDKTPRDHYIRALQQYRLTSTSSWGLIKAVQYAPQLAQRTPPGSKLHTNIHQDSGWLWEEKLEGHRTRCCISPTGVEWYSRDLDMECMPINLRLLTPFLPILQVKPGESYVLDTEITAPPELDALFLQAGISIGNSGDIITSLLEWDEIRDLAIRYRYQLQVHVLDVLEANGTTLVSQPLQTRLVIRKVVANRFEQLSTPQGVIGDEEIRTAFYAECIRNGLKGCVAKALGSVYATGKRPSTWVKVKCDALPHGDTETVLVETGTDIADFFSGIGVATPCRIEVGNKGIGVTQLDPLTGH